MDDPLVVLRANVDGFAAKVVAVYEDQMVCGPGCSDCCLVDLGVFPVEAARIRTAWEQLDPEIRQRVRDRKSAGLNCVFLVDDRCAVYGERPIICRTQGLPLKLPDGELSVCPKNFTEGLEGLGPAHVLELERLNMLLSILHRSRIKETGEEDRRVPLRDLVV